MKAPLLSKGKHGALALILVVAWSAPAAAQDPPLQHSLIDFVTGLPISIHLQDLFKDPLQRDAFMKAVEDAEGPDPKALAAKIKANQLDAPNRIKGIKFLGTVDCVEYPEARDKLLLALEQDPVEEVRYEAALALREMLSRGCGQQSGKVKCRRFFAHFHPEKIKKKLHPHELLHPHKLLAPEDCLLCQRKMDQRRRDWCLGCCNEDVLNKLANIAYGYDDTCCPVEPSERVREAVIKAMEACGVCCECLAAYADGCMQTMPAMPQPGTEEAVPPKTDEEAVPPAPPATEESEPKPEAQRGRIWGPRVTDASQGGQAAALEQASHSQQLRFPVIKSFGGYCVVGLKHREFHRASGDFSSEYNERTYFFSSAEAKAKFDETPETYAPAYAGFDPVQFVQLGEAREGRYLREYNDRFYLFVSKENYDTFLEDPTRYIMEDSSAEEE